LKRPEKPLRVEPRRMQPRFMRHVSIEAQSSHGHEPALSVLRQSGQPSQHTAQRGLVVA